MFCQKCGAKNEVDATACMACNAPMNQEVQAAAPAPQGGQSPTPTPVALVSVTEPGIMAIGGAIKIDARDEDNATLNLSGKPLAAKLIFMAVGVVAFIALLLPFYNAVLDFGLDFGWMGNVFHDVETEGFSGFGVISDVTLGILMVVVPIALVGLFHFKKQLTFAKGRLFMLSALICAVGFILPFLVRNSLSNTLGGDLWGSTLSVNFAAGSIISLILYAVAAIVSVGFVMAAKKK